VLFALYYNQMNASVLTAVKAVPFNLWDFYILGKVISWKMFLL